MLLSPKSSVSNSNLSLELWRHCLRNMALTYLASFRSEWGFITTLTQTKPFCCRALMLFINLAVPRDFSYVRSESSGTSMPAEPADRVVTEKPWPMLKTVMLFQLLPTRWLDMILRSVHCARAEAEIYRLQPVTRCLHICGCGVRWLAI